VDTVRREQRRGGKGNSGVGRRGTQTLPVIFPVNQIGRRENTVLPTAIKGVSADVIGAVKVDTAIIPLKSGQLSMA